MKKIQILGTGCPKCKKLAENAEAAAKAAGIEYELVKVTQINDIMAMGVMMTLRWRLTAWLRRSARFRRRMKLRRCCKAVIGDPRIVIS